MDEDEIVGKTCTKCGVFKLFELFSRLPKNKLKYKAKCKDCVREYNRLNRHKYREICNENKRVWRQNNPEKVKQQGRDWYKNNREVVLESQRGYQLKRNYGVDVEWYDSKIIEQDGVCALCRNTCLTGNRLAVDHDHRTGQVRGLICMRCNISLERAEGIDGWLETTIKYLEKYRSTAIASDDI